MRKITVLMPFEAEYRARLEAAFGDADVAYFDTPADCPDGRLIDSEVVVGNPPVALLPEMTKLRWIQLRMAGTDAYVKPGVLSEGVALTNATGAFGHAISEHMLAATLMMMKKLHLYRDNQHRCEWLDRGTVPSITSSTVLVLGMGDIGGEYARRMKALGAYVIGVRRADASKPDYADEVHLTSELDSLIGRADVIAMSLPSTPETVGILNAARFAMMKDGVFIVNVGRGNAIDSDALVDFARSGRLGGASIDVTDPEPLPPDHPLWRCEDVCVTPHISGFFHMRETYVNMVELMIDNAARYVEGRELRNVVDRATGYRRL